MNQPRAPRMATRKRHRPRVRKALQRATEAQEAPQSAIDELKALTQAQRRQMVYIAVQLFSERAAAPDLDPWKWCGNSTPARTIEFYRELWGHAEKCGHDLRDVLTPEEVEDRVHRALMADLLEDIDLSGLAA